MWEVQNLEAQNNKRLRSACIYWCPRFRVVRTSIKTLLEKIQRSSQKLERRGQNRWGCRRGWGRRRGTWGEILRWVIFWNLLFFINWEITIIDESLSVVEKIYWKLSKYDYIDKISRIVGVSMKNQVKREPSVIF